MSLRSLRSGLASISAAGISPANRSTTSTSLVSTGIGVSHTIGQMSTVPTQNVVSPDTPPIYFYLTGYASVSNNTAGDGVSITAYATSGSIPANGVVPGANDAAFTVISTLTSINAAQIVIKPFNDFFSNADIIKLSPIPTNGSVINIYIAIAAATGGTATLNNASLFVIS